MVPQSKTKSGDTPQLRDLQTEGRGAMSARPVESGGVLVVRRAPGEICHFWSSL